jgi:transketolase
MIDELGSFRIALARTLLELGESIRNMVVIDTDVARSTKTIYFAEKYPHRFIQVGISEQDAVGTAVGLSLSGKLPIIVAYSMFILRGWEQIRNTIARDNLNIKVIGTHAGISDYLDGSSHQCFEDIALMRILPNMKVIAPADEIATASLLIQMTEEYGPTYFRIGRDNAYKIYEDDDQLRLHKANILRDGEDATIISYGPLLYTALKAADELNRKEISIRVIDMHTIKPLDERIIIKAANETGVVIVIEDHNIYGGLGSAVAELLSTKRPIPVYRIGIEDRFGTGAGDYYELLNFLGLTTDELSKKIMVILNEI